MEKKKEAVKKVIAAMTVGTDVSMLFTDVVNCIQTQNIELKKLVYLYLINYAKPSLTSRFLRSTPCKGGATSARRTSTCAHRLRPLPHRTRWTRTCSSALAVRTMGCIRVDKIVEYLCDPLRKCLKA